MKTQKLYITASIVNFHLVTCAGLLLMLCLIQPSFAAEMPLPLDPASPEKEMRQAEQQFEKAASEFSQGEAQKGSNSQKTGQTTWSDLNANPPATKHKAAAPTPNDPRESALQGSPETGYAGTWTDPATGDIITSVIAPRPPQNQSQDYPIIIEPQVSGGDWGYNNNYNDYNSNWPQWPGYVGEPGYGTTPPPPPPGILPPGGYYPPPPGIRPPGGYYPPPPPQGPPFGPNGIGPNFRPPFGQIPPHPGYRPLRPYPPHPGFKPPNNPGIWKPGMEPPTNNFRPPVNNWGRPPHAFNPHPGFMPGNPPGWKPLPMRPGGQGWGPGKPIQPRGGF